MTTTLPPLPSDSPAEAPAIAKKPRVWPAVALVMFYWAFKLVTDRMELTMFEKFGARMIASGAVLLLFLVWWLVSRRVSWTQRLLVLGAAIVAEVAAGLVAHPSIRGFFWVVLTVPVLLTTWTLWWVVARGATPRLRGIGLVAVLFLTLGVYSLMRMDGLGGEQQIDLHWRWTPSPEQRYQAAFAARRGETVSGAVPVAATQSSPLVLRDGDWPAFRGPGRDGIARGLNIDAEWAARPPKLLWKHLVGPAWSSIAVVGNRVFTQEQRGQAEIVSCCDADGGAIVWEHEDSSRFAEPLAGPGPRATPTFAGGNLYTLGASGTLNCLDASTGRVHWSRDIAADAGAKPPMWGFASSPLVSDGIVVVYAGGAGNGLLAYHADSGKPAWSTKAGESSYASAQLAELNGQRQILFFSDGGLIAVDPDSGKLLWEYPKAAPGAPRTIQPHVMGSNQVLIESETDLGLSLVQVGLEGSSWSAQPKWVSRALKSSFNDFVVLDGYAYGFDGSIFCCTELAGGQRKWRTGRYGHGQVVLLPEQRMLLVTSEEGELILLSANPDASHELGRIQAVAGKTWNHPAVAHGRIYIRSNEEMACFELPRGAATP